MVIVRKNREYRIEREEKGEREVEVEEGGGSGGTPTKSLYEGGLRES
jgi:hypothetical protein